MARFSRVNLRALVMGVSVLALSACSEGIDFDLRGNLQGRDTSSENRQATDNRPNPDSRGIISYPNYQVAIAKRGDTVADVAQRAGINGETLASHNGLTLDTQLRKGEVLALPASATTQGGTLPEAEQVDVTTLAGNALDRVESSTLPAATPSARVEDGPEPIQHQVVRGETAYSISRLYNVSVRSLADWNGLGTSLTVREGQYLLIPTARLSNREEASNSESAVESTTIPGEGTVAPEPPSASQPLPEEDPEPIASETPSPPADLSNDRTNASSAVFSMPASGSIVRGYEKGKSDGIDIAAGAGAVVKAAGDGTVAAITRDTDNIPILVIRHSGNLLTVYANIEDLTLEKGDRVSKGQSIAKVRGSTLHFEVRQGFDSVNPVDYLN